MCLSEPFRSTLWQQYRITVHPPSPPSHLQLRLAAAVNPAEVHSSTFLSMEYNQFQRQRLARKRGTVVATMLVSAIDAGIISSCALVSGSRCVACESIASKVKHTTGFIPIATSGGPLPPYILCSFVQMLASCYHAPQGQPPPLQKRPHTTR